MEVENTEFRLEIAIFCGEEKKKRRDSLQNANAEQTSTRYS